MNDEMSPATAQDNELEWDSAISNEDEYIILPEGDYVFEVTDLERARFPGGPKIKPCPKAKLTLEVAYDGTKAVCRTDLILSRELEWKLCAFFRCIGMKEKGKKLVMDWSAVTGRRGKAHFKPRTYMKDGQERTINDCVRFLDPDMDYNIREYTETVLSDDDLLEELPF